VKVVLPITATTLVVLAVLVPAALTNWFRYPLSLEATFVLVPTLTIVVVGAILHVLAFRVMHRQSFAAYAAVASVVFATMVTMALSKEAFGYWVPRLPAADVDRNEDQVAYTSDGTTVVYHLELHNPFARSAKMYLVGTINDRPFKLMLPVGRIAGYAEAIQPSDWVTLSPTPRSGVYVANLTVNPVRKYTFEVDLERSTVRSLH
jgi:hypothetical protein